MQNLAKQLSIDLLARLPMWSTVEIERHNYAADDKLVLVASLVGKDPEDRTMKVVPTFRFELSSSSAEISWLGPVHMMPSEFADHWQTMEAMRKDLEKWWSEVTLLVWAVRWDEQTTTGH